MGKDVEGSGHDLYQGTVPRFACRDQSEKKTVQDRESNPDSNDY
jgi:hypothetical protein